MTNKEDEVIELLRESLEKHRDGLRDLEKVSQVYDRLMQKIASRDTVRVTKDNSSSLKFRNNAIVLINAGYDIEIVLDRKTALELANQIHGEHIV